MTTLRVHLLAEARFASHANGIHTAVSQLRRCLTGRAGVTLVPDAADADLIHAHTVGPNYLLQSLLRRERLLVSAHVLPETCLGGISFGAVCYRFTRLYLPWAYNRARLVLAVSPAVETRLRAQGVGSEIVTLPNSVDAARFAAGQRGRAEYRARLGIQAHEFVVLGVGQVQPRKGIWTFLDVARRLPDLRFVWVGGRPFGSATADYRRLGDVMAHPPENVHFAGIVALDEMPGYYGAADLFLFPSHQESFGYAVLEAAAAGLPLVLRDLPEYAGHFGGHYAAAHDTAGFAALVRQLSSNAGAYRARRQDALALAQKYDLPAYLDRLTELYRCVIAQGPRAGAGS